VHRSDASGKGLPKAERSEPLRWLAEMQRWDRSDEVNRLGKGGPCRFLGAWASFPWLL